MSRRHAPRQQLAREYGATDIVTERGDDGVARIKELTGGLGAHSVVEAVGTQESMLQAIRSTRPGGARRLRRGGPWGRAVGRGAVPLRRAPAQRAGPGAAGIRINAVCPGAIATPMVQDMIDKGELDVPEAVKNQPIGRLGRPDEIAAAVLWLCSSAASFVLGVSLPVDGGYTARYEAVFGSGLGRRFGAWQPHPKQQVTGCGTVSSRHRRLA